MNKIAKLMIQNATSKVYDGDRAFIPFTEEDGEQRITPFKKAVKIGFVPMTGGETPGGLNLTVLLDPQEKLLAYFLTGGTVDGITEELYRAFIDDDIIVVMGTDLNNELKSLFAIDKYDRSFDRAIYFPHFHNEWGVGDVIRYVFENAKLCETMDDYLEG